MTLLLARGLYPLSSAVLIPVIVLRSIAALLLSTALTASSPLPCRSFTTVCVGRFAPVGQGLALSE